MLSDSAIVKKIERQPKQTAGYKQLVRELGLHGEERKALSERLGKLVSSGQLIQSDSDRYAIPQAAGNKNLISGKLSLHRDGFGFVIPNLSSATRSLTARLSGDIFIPPHATGSSMHGDQVLVEITSIRADGRAEGRIVRPLHRAHATVVGNFHYGSRHSYVKALDAKIAHEIVIPRGRDYPEESPSVGGRPSPARAQDRDSGRGSAE